MDSSCEMKELNLDLKKMKNKLKTGKYKQMKNDARGTNKEKQKKKQSEEREKRRKRKKKR